MKRNAIKIALMALPESVKIIMRGIMITPLRTYFRYVPFRFGKDTLWEHVASHLWWLESYVKARTIFGSVAHVYAGDIVGRHIYYFGVWEPNLTNWIRHRLEYGDTFIDVGANIGYYSLLASKLVGDSGKVVSIEALPQIAKTLRRNLEINSVQNVRSVNVAAWDREELVTIYTNPKNPPGATTLMSGLAKEWNLNAHYEVSAAPLSKILALKEIQTARLIKIDVEGAEWRVVCGLASVLRECRKDLEIIVEVNNKTLKEEGKSCKEFCDFLNGWGFNPYLINNDYSGASCFGKTDLDVPKRMEPIPRDLVGQVDIIFSRVDATSI